MDQVAGHGGGAAAAAVGGGAQQGVEDAGVALAVQEGVQELLAQRA